MDNSLKKILIEGKKVYFLFYAWKFTKEQMEMN